ncbi:putative hydrolase [Melanomma pulvis-pyrius CBS 109.77]|uniref:Putative hydrolase n=1 Tax=Melanomma pulvis-pyrius CBS 109.77 TaxID=1314802 RepID=A0A6A6XF22_9PLEO|nr:putative hydrolase [Melanomma pulvis-pyrius CBS 109.77]
MFLQRVSRLVVLWAFAILFLYHTVEAHLIPHYDPAGEQIFIKNNNVTIHYRKYGSGPYLIFQHGFPDRETTFNDFQIPVFAKSHTVLTPTLRGYPPSSVPPNVEDYAVEHFTSDLLAILDHERASNVTLVGHDIGGAVAQNFALNHTERVKALVMVNTPVVPVFLPLISFHKEEQDYARYTIPYYSYEPGQPKNISLLVKNIRNATYRSEIANYLQQSPIDGMLHFYDLNYPGPPYGVNFSIQGFVQKVPSLLIWGEEDPYFSPKLLDGLQKWFENGIRLVTVPEAGHWVYRDQWKRFNREIWSFLRITREIEVDGGD